MLILKMLNIRYLLYNKKWRNTRVRHGAERVLKSTNFSFFLGSFAKSLQNESTLTY